MVWDISPLHSLFAYIYVLIDAIFRGYKCLLIDIRCLVQPYAPHTGTLLFEVIIQNILRVGKKKKKCF